MQVCSDAEPCILISFLCGARSCTTPRRMLSGCTIRACRSTPTVARLIKSFTVLSPNRLLARQHTASPQTRNVTYNLQLAPSHPSSRVLNREDASERLVKSDAQKTTIYALSTPPGKAGVAVIRVSGPHALDVWQSMVTSKGGRSGKISGKDDRIPRPWKMYRCDVVHPETSELLDSGLAVFFKGVHSSQPHTSITSVNTLFFRPQILHRREYG